MSKNIAYFQHEKDVGPGRLKDIFGELGFKQHIFYTPEYDLQDFVHARFDVLVILGGSMHANDIEAHPYLEHEINIIKERAETGQAVHALCLGAQMTAKALGASVFRGERGWERGFGTIVTTRAGALTAARHLDKDKTYLAQFHQDTFDLPKGAVLLAQNKQYKNQIFSYGEKRHIMAIQGHPEVDFDDLQSWTDNIEDRDEAEKILDDADKYMARMDKQYRLFMNRWLKKVDLIP